MNDREEYQFYGPSKPEDFNYRPRMPYEGDRWTEGPDGEDIPPEWVNDLGEVMEVVTPVARAGASFVADLTPGLGTAKGVQEFATDKDYVTGKPVGWFGRVTGLLPIVGALGDFLKGLGKLRKVSVGLDEGSDAASTLIQLAEKHERAMDSARLNAVSEGRDVPAALNLFFEAKDAAAKANAPQTLGQNMADELIRQAEKNVRDLEISRVAALRDGGDVGTATLRLLDAKDALHLAREAAASQSLERAGDVVEIVGKTMEGADDLNKARELFTRNPDGEHHNNDSEARVSSDVPTTPIATPSDERQTAEQQSAESHDNDGDGWADESRQKEPSDSTTTAAGKEGRAYDVDGDSYDSDGDGWADQSKRNEPSAMKEPAPAASSSATPTRPEEPAPVAPDTPQKPHTPSTEPEPGPASRGPSEQNPTASPQAASGTGTTDFDAGAPAGASTRADAAGMTAGSDPSHQNVGLHAHVGLHADVYSTPVGFPDAGMVMVGLPDAGHPDI
ncbi:pre-toxin TG domain-containing protein, partial [Arthrobacter sp. ISL-28]|uniref:pre-toxin TG domain-containing protein n=1 Tax=Arthrobacter sp. ISL-28 TaxID=2819108 RepID=UPI001C1BE261